MSKSFQDVFNEVKSEIKKNKKSGKSVKSFSKSAFDKLAKALINEPGYVINSVAVKNGKVEDREIKPVEKFRSGLKLILQDFGVDKQEAARVLDSSYEIRSVEGFYELVSELLYTYVDAGKKFDFIPRKDFIGSLSLREVEEMTTEHKNIQDPTQVFKVKKGKHKQLEKKSKAPRWLKTRLK